MSRVEVPFNDPGAQYRLQKAAIDAAVSRVLESGWYIGGPEVEAFESAFARATEAPHAVGVANGTDAIALALRALGVGRGDEVIVPAVSAYPTAVAVAQAEAVPVFVDIREDDGTIDPDQVEVAITPRTKAVVPVHLYGNCADVAALADRCRRSGLVLVEDCAQAHAGRLHDRALGTWGDAGAWSFYPTKNLGALGDAGAVTCADPAIAARLRELRNYGQRNRYEHVTRGVNSRLDPIQAAILRVKLERLALDTTRRRAIASTYDAGLADLACLRPLRHRPESLPSRHLYPVLLGDETDREAFQNALHAGGIETLIHYPIPMPDQEATPLVCTPGTSYPVARSFCRRIVSLPLYPTLTDEQVGTVIAVVRRWAEAP